jgi:hypothetical protein
VHTGSCHTSKNEDGQDAARHGIIRDKVAFIIGSDGCSSAKDAKQGAKLMVETLELALRDMHGENLSPEILNAHQYALISNQHLPSMSIENMLATCLYAYLARDGGFVHIRGDGGIVRMYDDGSADVFFVDWRDGMPYYPTYSLAGLEHVFRSAHAKQSERAVTARYWTYDPSRPQPEMFAFCGRIPRTLDEGIEGITIPLEMTTDGKHLTAVAIYSDGVAQMAGTHDGYHEKQVMVDLLSKSGIRDSSLTQHMQKYLESAAAKGQVPWDDIFCATIHVDYEETE